MRRFAQGIQFTFCLLSLLAMESAPALARAPDTFDEMHARPTVIDSPAWYAFELRVGPYSPDANPDFKDTFGNDRGWLFGLELDATLWHIPYVGQLNVGGAWGRAKYDAKAFNDSDGGRAGEKTEFTLYPMSALGVVRIDALSRLANIPILFTGKVGYDFVRWHGETGGRSEGSGLNQGLHWAGQVGLELDFFEMDGARALDQEFGINHTFLFLEYFESKTKATGSKALSFGFGTIF